MMVLLAKDFDGHENTINIMLEVDYLIRFMIAIYQGYF